MNRDQTLIPISEELHETDETRAVCVRSFCKDVFVIQTYFNETFRQRHHKN